MSDLSISSNNSLQNLAPLLQPSDSKTSEAANKKQGFGNALSLSISNGKTVLATDIGSFNVNLPPALAKSNLPPTSFDFTKTADGGMQTATGSNFNAFLVLLAIMESMGSEQKAQYLSGLGNMKGNIANTLGAAAAQKKAALTDAVGGMLSSGLTMAAGGVSMGMSGISNTVGGETSTTTAPTAPVTPTTTLPSNGINTGSLNQAGVAGLSSTDISGMNTQQLADLKANPAFSSLSPDAKTTFDLQENSLGTTDPLAIPGDTQTTKQTWSKTTRGKGEGLSDILKGAGGVFDSIAKISAADKRQGAAQLDAQAQVMQACMKQAGVTLQDVEALMKQVVSLIQAQGQANQSVMDAASQGMQAGA